MWVPGGDASCLGVGRPGKGALPPPTSRPFGRAAGAHYSQAVGAGGAGVGTRHRPHSARSCMLWGRHEGARGQRLLPVCGASGDGRSPTPDLSSVRACGRGPLPTGCGCGPAGVGARHQPHNARSCELALRAVGAACGCPGGTPLAWVWGVRGLALSHPRRLVRSGLRPGPTTHRLWVRGGAGVGTRQQPHSARSCVLWGLHEGARGGRLLPGCGASGDGRSPTPSPWSVRACGRGPLPTGFGCGGVRAWGPVTNPTARALACCGGGMRVPGGGASCLGVARLGTGALPPPTSGPFGRAAGARFPLAVGAVCGRGGPAVLGTLSRAAVHRLLCALPVKSGEPLGFRPKEGTCASTGGHPPGETSMSRRRRSALPVLPGAALLGANIQV